MAEQAASEFELCELMGPAFYELHKDIWRHGHTHYVLEGGRGSGKSSFVAIEVLLLLLKKPMLHAVVFRKVARTLRNTVFEQYLWAIERLGLKGVFEVKLHNLEIINSLSGQKILFLGVDDREKIKSIKAPFGYFGITHFEEKNQFCSREEIRYILQATMRGGDKFWNFETNNPPVSLRHWANVDSLEKRSDRLIHKSDYRDMPRGWLGEAFFAEAEMLKEKNLAAYKNEYLGIAVGSGSMVFTNLEGRELSDEEVAEFDYSYMGLDWGYYPDPFAWNRIYYDAARQEIYIYDELTCFRMGNEETAELLVKKKGVLENEEIIADSAERKSIEDYKKMGILCRAAKKGRGGVAYLMKWLQARRRIIIDPVRCPDTYREFCEYEYLRDKDGDVVEGLPDKNNHHIDAVRYAFSLYI